MENKENFFIDQSKINEEEKYVSVPVNYPEYYDRDDVVWFWNKVEDELKKKYPDINFSGISEGKSGEDGKEEFLFYFE